MRPDIEAIIVELVAVTEVVMAVVVWDTAILQLMVMAAAVVLA